MVLEVWDEVIGVKAAPPATSTEFEALKVQLARDLHSLLTPYLAARLEGLAEAGGLCISGTVYDQIKTKLTLQYEDLGAQAVKNIAEPVRVYRVQLEPGAAVPAVREQEERAVGDAGRPLPQKGRGARRVWAWSWRKGALALVGLLFLLGEV